MSSIKDIREKYRRRSDELKISVVSPVCTLCRNFDMTNPAGRKCSAFPSGIPLKIWNGENDHTKPYPGDNGIGFISIERKRAA